MQKRESNFNSEYLKVLEAISEVAIIAYTDKSGKITFANENFCRISGYTLNELIHKNHRVLNSNYHDEAFFNTMYETISAKKIWRGEIRNKKKDGSFYWVDTQIIPILDQSGEIESFASIRFDITERKRLDAAIIEMDKLNSVCSMARLIAHEINNPLTIIELCCSALNRELNDSSPNHLSRKRIFKIIEQSKRIALIVKDLKTFSPSKRIGKEAA